MNKVLTSLCAIMLTVSLVTPSLSMAQTSTSSLKTDLPATNETEYTSQLESMGQQANQAISTNGLESSNKDTESELDDPVNSNEQTENHSSILESEIDSDMTSPDSVKTDTPGAEIVDVPLTVEAYFSDVPKNAYYYKELQHAIENNFIKYNEKRLFNGNQIVTRMDIVHLLVQVMELNIDDNQAIPTFKDIQPNDPNMPYVAAVVNAGYMRGDDLGKFNPTKTLTRAELATVLQNTFQLQAATAQNFHDVTKKAWYEGAVRALLTNGISNGYQNYLFKPEANLSRAEMFVFFARASESSFRLTPLNIPASTVEGFFGDVPPQSFYYKELQYAIENNFLNYDERRLFNGNQIVTRMDVVRLLVQVMGLNVNANQTIPTFKDVHPNNPDMPYIAAVVNAGFMRGDNLGQFNPTKTLTRAELATVIKNAFQLRAGTAHNFHDVPKKAWYEEAVRALLTNGISNGYSNYLFKAEANLSRAEMFVFFVRASESSFRLTPLNIPERSCARPTESTTYRVDVAVMNIWKYYNIARPVDQPAMTDPVNYSKWISSMSLDQKKWLVDRTDTQALYNDEVKILEERGNMYRVAAVDQWVPYNSSGYPGWVPKAHVSGTNFDTSECQVAIVTADKAPILNMDTTHYLSVSYSTILPVIRVVGNWVVVQTPNAGEKVIDRRFVKVYDSYQQVTKPTRADIVNEAKRFLNLPYLWAGTSSWGYDCSGIIYAVYRNFGIMIPRDSFYQAIRGKAVSKKNLKPGDLIFFAYNGGTGKVYHVGIYVSPGMMLHAPHYASQVKIESFETGVYARNYAGARSYLD